MAKINQEEYEVLKELDNKWKWIARTESRAVKTFLSKPRKRLHWLFDGSGSWDIKGNENFGIYTNYADLFQFIQWEDENPYDIAELIEEYESEETEVKDIEWLNKEVNELPLMFVGFSVLKQREEFAVNKDDVLELINQLDEPEVLSQEWIRDNLERKGIHFYVNTFKLQNLLVPKQELPVIPRFVVEWIEKYVEYGYDLYPALKKMENNARSWERIYNWYRNNTLEFVLAYLTQEYEIEVEEEQKYYVLNNEKYFLLGKDKGHGFIFSTGGNSKLGSMERTSATFELTEQEIKGYDPRYMTFAKSVEELEEC